MEKNVTFPLLFYLFSAISPRTRITSTNYSCPYLNEKLSFDRSSWYLTITNPTAATIITNLKTDKRRESSWRGIVSVRSFSPRCSLSKFWSNYRCGSSSSHSYHAWGGVIVRSHPPPPPRSLYHKVCFSIDRVGLIAEWHKLHYQAQIIFNYDEGGAAS